jgi:hypothetical protein
MKASLIEFERERCALCDREFAPIRRNKDGSATYSHVCLNGRRETYRKHRNGEYTYFGCVTVGAKF